MDEIEQALAAFETASEPARAYRAARDEIAARKAALEDDETAIARASAELAMAQVAVNAERRALAAGQAALAKDRAEFEAAKGEEHGILRQIAALVKAYAD